MMTPEYPKIEASHPEMDKAHKRRIGQAVHFFDEASAVLHHEA